MNTSTLIRTLVLLLALANQLLVATGHSALPIDDAQIETLVSTVVTIGASLWSWWANNSITKAAKAGDTVMRAVKNGNLDANEVEELVAASSK